LVDLRERVRIEFQHGWPLSLAELEVTTTDGGHLAARHDSGIPTGDIAGQGRRLAAKFDALVEPLLGAPRARELRETVAGLFNLTDIGNLARLAAA
jgi:hypothetical protein